MKGEVWCWGGNFLGQLDNGTGRDATCALDDQGKAWGWGANDVGQLGRPHRASSATWSRSALTLLVVGCAGRSAPAITNAHQDTPSSTDLPCNATTVAALSPYGARPPGACTAFASLAFDYRGGKDRRMLFESGHPILSSDPSARTVVFDARIPTPRRIRVGMTGADLELLHPTAEMKCTTDDPAWRGHLLCRLRDNTECAAEDANWSLLLFDGEPRAATVADARALVRTRKIIAIDLGPGCGES